MSDQRALIAGLRELRQKLPAEMIHHEGLIFDAAQETLSRSEPHLNYKKLDSVVALANASGWLLDLAERGLEAERLRTFVADVIEMTDYENPDSYVSDDPRACLEAIADKARKLAQETNDGQPAD
jgi:hypothetical protein